jgi:hypothetical protein
MFLQSHPSIYDRLVFQLKSVIGTFFSLFHMCISCPSNLISLFW